MWKARCHHMFFRETTTCWPRTHALDATFSTPFSVGALSLAQILWLDSAGTIFCIFHPWVLWKNPGIQLMEAQEVNLKHVSSWPKATKNHVHYCSSYSKARNIDNHHKSSWVINLSLQSS
jgi:hypothetical protein